MRSKVAASSTAVTIAIESVEISFISYPWLAIATKKANTIIKNPFEQILF
jgi:hypothetical protein